MRRKGKASIVIDIEKQLFYMWKEMRFVSLCIISIGLCRVIQSIYIMAAQAIADIVCVIGVLGGCVIIAVGRYGIALSKAKETLQEEYQLIVTRNKELLLIGWIECVVAIIFMFMSTVMIRIDNMLFLVFNISSIAMLLFAYWCLTTYREEKIVVFEEEIWLYNIFGKINKVKKSEIKRIELYHNQNCYHFFDDQMEELFHMSLKMKGADALIQNVVNIHTNY